ASPPRLARAAWQSLSFTNICSDFELGRSTNSLNSDESLTSEIASIHTPYSSAPSGPFTLYDDSLGAGTYVIDTYLAGNRSAIPTIKSILPQALLACRSRHLSHFSDRLWSGLVSSVTVARKPLKFHRPFIENGGSSRSRRFFASVPGAFTFSVGQCAFDEPADFQNGR